MAELPSTWVKCSQKESQSRISMTAKIMDRHCYLSRAVMSQAATKTCYDPIRGGIRKYLNYLKKVVLAGMVGFSAIISVP